MAVGQNNGEIYTEDWYRYFQRQTIIPDGSRLQSALAQCRCLVVGMGGLGCTAALYLGLSGVTHLGICDADRVEFSNLSRQILFTPGDVGELKVATAKDALARQLPFSDISVHNYYLDNSTAGIIDSYDVVLDCVDNFSAKYCIHDNCLRKRKGLVQGAIYQHYGQVATFPFSHAEYQGACMRCLWPETPRENKFSNCAEGGILTVVAGVVALAQVSAAMHLANKEMRNGMQTYSNASQSWQHIAIPSNLNCICRNILCEPPAAQTPPEIPAVLPDQHSVLELYALPDRSENWVIMDMRRKKEQQNCFFTNFMCVPISEQEELLIENITAVMDKVQNKEHYLFVCDRGNRSLAMVRRLRKQGRQFVYSFAGGVAALMNSGC